MDVQNITISQTETLILSLLADSPRGAFGSELVAKSDGKLKRGSVYALLGRLEKAGYVASSEVPATEVYALARTKYKLTAAGASARTGAAQWMGLAIPGAAA